MSTTSPVVRFVERFDRRWLALGAGVIGLTTVARYLQGQPWWCKCGSWVPWSWETVSSHNSQHILDAYAFTHMLHGVLFFGLLALPYVRKLPLGLRAVIAMSIEAVWEFVENTDWIIGRYREATISLDYYGDSIINSLADIGWCLGGFLVASQIPWWASVALYFGTEAVLLATIRDSLTVNVIMLVWPLQAIKDWQAGG